MSTPNYQAPPTRQWSRMSHRQQNRRARRRIMMAVADLERRRSEMFDEQAEKEES